jgi:hypothetical protein
MDFISIATFLPPKELEVNDSFSDNDIKGIEQIKENQGAINYAIKACSDSTENSG